VPPAGRSRTRRSRLEREGLGGDPRAKLDAAGQRHIGDLARREEPDAYSKALERLLRDLTVEASPVADG
jgi:hypothetical protein